MARILVLDMDGVFCDRSKSAEICTVDRKMNWNRFLSSELLHLDEPMPDAFVKMQEIGHLFDRAVLLTSRYDHMLADTIQWLNRWGMGGYFNEWMFKKWDTERYQKTTEWKRDKIKYLLSFPDVEYMLIVDDEEKNIQSILSIGDKRICCTSSLGDVKL